MNKNENDQEAAEETAAAEGAAATQANRAGCSAHSQKIALANDKRVLFLTKDLDLIKQQLYEGLNLKMEDINPNDLLDDINTDVMTPAWVCFDHDPSEIAKNA